ncbi:shikimate dehydrogenase [Candidatus Pandoraea novymonadis]|uniref:Shikimate dehydrogenase (NADP(+)) n=1 Tax=Candidatus Pandoraea novymonadis TaxID=1808959 RepID=A0ABX5FG58_9BURK|nr:shikimate dehydrogenase [Candidatus Pandoraea novymonadis]PSB92365.1 Shikimate dehydrogenase (NADP(+)) [Candidatus Pandoraea novymonadis]
MVDRYVVIGNPIEHSQSPYIHSEFARLTGQCLTYERLLAPLDGFESTVRAFIALGGCGANVTLPFKLEGYRVATRLTERAQSAGAVNTLQFFDEEIVGDNTDGMGLVTDIERNLGLSLRGRRVLLLGAGGAARGAILPILSVRPAFLFVANRTPERAINLIEHFKPLGESYGVALSGGGWDAVPNGFDFVINATSASLHGEVPLLNEAVFEKSALAYDMMYGSQPTVFMRQLERNGIRVVDGLGMLVEQAAETFAFWRGVRPDTATILAALRIRLSVK